MRGWKRERQEGRLLTGRGARKARFNLLEGKSMQTGSYPRGDALQILYSQVLQTICFHAHGLTEGAAFFLMAFFLRLSALKCVPSLLPKQPILVDC